MEFLTKSDIQQMAPVVFADKATRDLSNQYIFHNTESVIDDLAQLNWHPVAASQRTQRKNKASVYSPHMVTFQNPDIRIQGADGDESIPQILLKNRHDGLGSFTMMAGLFRMICSNGLVIATETFSSVKIPHKGYSFEKVREIVAERVNALPGQVQIMNDMKNRDMTKDEQYELGLDGLLIRAGVKLGSNVDEKDLYDQDTVAQVLQSLHKEDRGNDLWSTFNTVQENLTKGNFMARKYGQERARRVRELKSFEKDIQFNQDLFKRATQFIPEAQYELV